MFDVKMDSTKGSENEIQKQLNELADQYGIDLTAFTHRVNVVFVTNNKKRHKIFRDEVFPVLKELADAEEKAIVLIDQFSEKKQMYILGISTESQAIGNTLSKMIAEGFEKAGDRFDERILDTATALAKIMLSKTAVEKKGNVSEVIQAISKAKINHTKEYHEKMVEHFRALSVLWKVKKLSGLSGKQWSEFFHIVKAITTDCQAMYSNSERALEVAFSTVIVTTYGDLTQVWDFVFQDDAPECARALALTYFMDRYIKFRSSYGDLFNAMNERLVPKG